VTSVVLLLLKNECWHFVSYFYHFIKNVIKRTHDAYSAYDIILEKSLMLPNWCSRCNALIHILFIL